MNIGYLSEPKYKLGLPRVKMEFNKPLNQSPQGDLEKIDYTSSNGAPRNYCKVLNEHTIGHVLVRQNGGSTVTHNLLTNSDGRPNRETMV